MGGVGWGGVGGPCDFSVSPSPFGLDFGTLDFGTSDLGLTIVKALIIYHFSVSRIVDPAPVDEKYVKHAVLVIRWCYTGLTLTSLVATSAFQKWCDKKLL